MVLFVEGTQILILELFSILFQQTPAKI